MNAKISDIAADVATLLGESIALECMPEESPFPSIEEKVRILAPLALAEVSSHPQHLRPFPAVSHDDSLEIPDHLYAPMLLNLKGRL